MTSNSRPARRRTCVDCKVQLNSSNTRDYRADDSCDRCMDLAGIYNDHQDGRHDDDQEGPHDECIGCGHVIKDRSRKGHEGTVPATQGSHADCYAKGLHPATKAGRAACRKGRQA